MVVGWVVWKWILIRGENEEKDVFDLVSVDKVNDGW